MAKRRKELIKNHKLFQEAKAYLVGGVNSPVRSFKYVGSEPILIKSGKGARIFDYDNNEYIDYVLSWGSIILGHAHPRVTEKLKQAITSGLSFGATGRPEIELAKIISSAIPFIEKIRFVNSGTEAVMAALRLSRGYTNRDKILKFEHAYHGHADYLLVKGGSGLATLGIPSSKGVPRGFVKDTLVASFGNIEQVEKTFKRYGRQIAAVIVEPVGGNFGVLPLNPDFLKRLRQITRENKAILIFDEIITGFRFGFGSVADILGVKPDLICLGKIIGGGLPIGALAGKERIMNNLAPLGKVYQASTFCGNPIIMQAGLATLRTLEKIKDDYRKLERLTEILSLFLRREAMLRNINLKVNYFGTMFSLRFEKKQQFRQFYRHILKQGIYFAPSEFEANFLSFAHTEEDIDNTINCARYALSKVATSKAG